MQIGRGQMLPRQGEEGENTLLSDKVDKSIVIELDWGFTNLENFHMDPKVQDTVLWILRILFAKLKQKIIIKVVQNYSQILNDSK